MHGINKVMLVGRAGGKPTYRPGTTQVAMLRLATTLGYTRKDGQKVEEVEWHSVSAFGAVAGILLNHVNTGDTVGVEGRLKTKKWTDKNGVDHYSTEVLADRIHLLGSASHIGSNSKPSVEADAEELLDIPF